MALIKCPECGKEVSDKAAVCPNCGVEIAPDEVKAVICPECGSEIDPAQNICKNCGYDPVRIAKGKSRKKKKIITIVLCAAVLITIIAGVAFLINANKRTSYVVEACKELSSAEHGLPDIKAIYTSEDAGDDSTINYVYRVYIEYMSGSRTNQVLYLVDKKDETFYITKGSKEDLSSYLSMAYVEIFGVKGFLDPHGNWDKMSASDIAKIKDKVE